MANLDIIATQGSRIFNDDSSMSAAGAENASVADWVIGDQFVLAAIVWGGGGCNKVTNSQILRLDFSKDGGAWTPVGAATEISYTTSTNITDGANITTNLITGDVPSAQCGASATTEGVQEEGSGTFATFSITSESWTEVWIALDTSNASGGSTYEFSLYNTSISQRLTYNDGGLTADEPLLTDLTMAAGGAPIEASAADGIDFSDADSTLLTAVATAPDGVLFIGSPTKVVAYEVVAPDGATFAELLNKAVSTEATAPDGIVFSESIDNAVSIEVSLADGIILSETANKVAVFTAAALDSIVFTEAPSKTVIFEVTAPDGITIADVSTKAVAFEVSASEIIITTDNVTGGMVLEVTCDDGMSVSELVNGNITIEALVASGIITVDMTAALPCSTSNKITNGDAADTTYTDSSVHALTGWTNVGSHDASNKITIE